jgi:hypothetical protein
VGSRLEAIYHAVLDEKVMTLRNSTRFDNGNCAVLIKMGGRERKEGEEFLKSDQTTMGGTRRGACPPKY